MSLNVRTKEALNDAIMIINRGSKICLAAFPHKPVKINIPHMVVNNIYKFGIRGAGPRKGKLKKFARESQK